MSAVYVFILALVHVFAGQFRILSIVPRSRWLSAAGGVAVAYVFIHLLPALAAHQEEMRRLGHSFAPALEAHVYLLALAGLIAFYGLDRYVELSHVKKSETEAVGDVAPKGVFWLHIASFTIYNALIGYLMASKNESATSAALFFFAMAVHFLTNDYGLWLHHRSLYNERGRWVLAFGVLAGWGLSFIGSSPDIWIGVVFSFLSGSVVLNVMKDELPDERESSFSAFALGAVLYSTVLLAV